jgi:hypothetical protein
LWPPAGRRRAHAWARLRARRRTRSGVFDCERGRCGLASDTDNVVSTPPTAAGGPTRALLAPRQQRRRAAAPAAGVRPR